jgi:hypothetical protein
MHVLDGAAPRAVKGPADALALSGAEPRVLAPRARRHLGGGGAALEAAHQVLNAAQAPELTQIPAPEHKGERVGG